MFNIAAYTPLESLLLIQSLVAHGSVDPPAFTHVSSLLTANSFIKDDDRYDEKRLSPGSLQELFLQILRDELKLEVENADKSAPDGSVSPNKRRKLQAPSPHTLQEAHPYLPKVPALFDRLYSRYQEHQIRRIREDEERFDRVQSEIKALLEEEDRERKEKEAQEARRERDATVYKHVPPVKPEERKGTVTLPNGTGAPAGAGPALAPSLGGAAQPGERPQPIVVATAPPAKPQLPIKSTSKPASGLPKQPSPGLKPAPLHAPAAVPTPPAPPPRSSAPATPNIATPNQPATTIAHLPSPSPAHALARPVAAPAGGSTGVPLEPHTPQAPAQAAITGPQVQPSALQHVNVPPRRPAPAVTPQHSLAASNAPPSAPPLAKVGVAPPSQFGQAAASDVRHEPARPANGAVGSPVLQHPQGVVVSSPRPTQSPQPQPPQLGVLQRPEAVGKPKVPPPPQQATPTPPAGTPLKWEPPYKPPQPSAASQRPQVGPPGLGHHQMVPQTWTPHTHAQVQAHSQAQAAAIHAHAQAQAAQAQTAQAQTAQAQAAHAQVVQGYLQAHPQGQTQAQAKPQNHALAQGQTLPPYQSPTQLQARNTKSQQAQKPPPQPSHPVIFSHKPVLVPPQHPTYQLQAPAADSRRPPVPPVASTQQPQRVLQTQPAQPMPARAVAPSVPTTPIPAQTAPPAHRPPVAASPTPVPTPTHPPPKRPSPTQPQQSPRISGHTQPQPPKPNHIHQQIYANPQPHAPQQSPNQQQTRPHPPLQQNIHPQGPVRLPVPASVVQNTQQVPAVTAPTKAVSPGPAAHSTPAPPPVVSQPEILKQHASPYDTTTPVATASGSFRPQVSTPKPPAAGHRWAPLLPQTPVNVGDVGYFSRHGSATRWKSNPTPSTPNAVEASGMAAPPFEPLSPVRSLATLAVPSATSVSLEGLADSAASQQSQPKAQSKKQQTHKLEAGSSPKARQSRQPRSKMHDVSASKEVEAQQQPSPVDEVHKAAREPDSAKVKDEEETPRPMDETGDTTADESGPSQRHPAPSSGLPSRRGKRKRGESAGPDRANVTPAASVSEAPAETTAAAPLASTPVVPRSEPPSHILWTRGFPRISSSALDQIGSHRHANMFAHQIRDRDAPGYKNIVLGPMDLKSIRAAINHGNKAATQAAAALPDGDPGTSTVWLPISEDLVPPRGIINSAQLDRELVHMFANAIMYNPDPQRGFGPSFLRDDDEDEAADEADASTAVAGVPGSNVLGYKVDENAVVNDTRSMFVEVEKLLSNMRAAEISRGAPPPPPGSTGLVSAASQNDDANGGASLDGADDREGTAATDGDGTGSVAAGTSGTIKRRRITRG